VQDLAVTVVNRAAIDAVEPESWSLLEQLGRSLHLREPTLSNTLDRIVETAVETMGAVDWASVNLLVRDRFVPQATCGEPPHVLDNFQQRTGYGPCVDAARTQTVVCVDDMSSEQRWPDLPALAQAAGISSMLCLPLWIDDRVLGSLSIFSSRAYAFDHGHEQLAALFAAHAAIALADAQRNDNLREALRNRDVIGQAKGILMERHKITPEAAFERLSQRSQQRNRKLADLAEQLVETGELP
jgi:GAF domain-containing protein